MPVSRFLYICTFTSTFCTALMHPSGSCDSERYRHQIFLLSEFCRLLVDNDRCPQTVCATCKATSQLVYLFSRLDRILGLLLFCIQG